MEYFGWRSSDLYQIWHIDAELGAILTNITIIKKIQDGGRPPFENQKYAITRPLVIRYKPRFASRRRIKRYFEFFKQELHKFKNQTWQTDAILKFKNMQ